MLVVLRRGEYGDDIHSLLGPVEKELADLVRRGQESGVFGQHLPPEILSQVAWSTVFAVADSELPRGKPGLSAVTMTSLLLLGAPQSRAEELVGPLPAQPGRAGSTP